MSRRAAILCLAAVAALALVPAGALAGHTAFEQVSQGGNATHPAQFVGASADGTRVILRTEEPLAPSDTDGEFDLYERAGGITTHLSTGPIPGNSAAVANLGGMSDDGRHVFFEIGEALVASDTDDCGEGGVPSSCTDVYESFDGTTTLISTGPGGDGAYGAAFAGASKDGARAFFVTEESLSASDTDSQVDVYERAGATTTLVTTGSAGGNGPFQSSFRGASADGTRVFFTTSEQLTLEDTDTAPDVYERVGAGTNLLSTGPAGGNSGAGAAFEGASRNGARTFLSTTEQLTSQDTDSALDLYERSFGATTLLSAGPAGGNGSLDATFKVSSEVGTRVLFETSEQLVSSDTDEATDVYELFGGTTTLVSTGPLGGNGGSDALFQGASSDGTRVVFGTVESLVPSDTDSMLDLYERAGSVTTLVSTAPGSGNGAFEVFFSHMSDDGQQVFFETLEPLVSDTDSLPDVYERTAGATTRISTGTGGGNGDFIAVFLGAADDGSRVFFNTAEVLAGTDGDTSSDVYVARTTDTYVRPKGATPLSVPLVIAYRECSAPTNRVHGPPGLGGALSNPSCAPPEQASEHLTVGTFDANQRAVQSTGRVSYTVQTGNPSTPDDEADILLHLDMNDVRLAGSLDDYAGELTVSSEVRITDRQNGSVAADPGTVVEMPFEFVAQCAATADTGTGGTCVTDTTADAIVPGAIKESFRSSWELNRVEVYDGGADGVAATSGNTLFAVQGIFVP